MDTGSKKIVTLVYLRSSVATFFFSLILLNPDQE
jgi:hypothetical protein